MRPIKEPGFNLFIGLIVLFGVALPLSLDMTGVLKDRADQADKWCESKFDDQYKGLGNVQAFVDGGSHCMLKNNTWINVPNNISEDDY